MPIQLPLTVLLLFASMFVPLPSPVGLAISLWAIGSGISLPLLLCLYIVQDVLTYTAIGWLLPRFHARFAAQASTLLAWLPEWLRRSLTLMAGPATAGGAGLFAAALVSFYAGAALAALRDASRLHSAAIVIGTDVARYTNALALALGATILFPSSPISTVVAVLFGVAATLLVRAVSVRARTVLALSAAAQSR